MASTHKIILIMWPTTTIRQTKEQVKRNEIHQIMLSQFQTCSYAMPGPKTVVKKSLVVELPLYPLFSLYGQAHRAWAHYMLKSFFVQAAQQHRCCVVKEVNNGRHPFFKSTQFCCMLVKVSLCVSQTYHAMLIVISILLCRHSCSISFFAYFVILSFFRLSSTCQLVTILPRWLH